MLSKRSGQQKAAPPPNRSPRRGATIPGAADIIGDVHGHAEELHALLEHLGYRRSSGVWRHPEFRQAIFTGDLIDYGPDPRGVLRTVSDMMRAGSARCVMGNHEFNSLLHYNKGPGGRPLRPMTWRQLTGHETTIRTLVNPFPEEWRGWLKWMQSLPLWHDAGSFRVVHACWDREARAFLIRPQLDDHLLAACAEDGPERHFVDILLKGPVLTVAGGRPLPQPVRLRWWSTLPDRPTLQDAAVDELPAEFATLALPGNVAPAPYSPDAPPLFIGHYHRTGAASPQVAPNVICVDAGVAHGGRLAAWRLHSSNRLPVFAA